MIDKDGNQIDPPRVVTEREIFDLKFSSLHKVCMDLACQEAKKCSETYKIPIENFDISALTYQLFRIWVDRQEYIKAIMKARQEELDKRFKQ